MTSKIKSIDFIQRENHILCHSNVYFQYVFNYLSSHDYIRYYLSSYRIQAMIWVRTGQEMLLYHLIRSRINVFQTTNK